MCKPGGLKHWVHLTLWLLPSSKNLSQCSAAAQEPSPDLWFGKQGHCCCLITDTGRRGLTHLWEIFGMAKNCPGNSPESYFNRLGQVQRESFGAICHNFALQTRTSCSVHHPQTESVPSFRLQMLFIPSLDWKGANSTICDAKATADYCMQAYKVNQEKTGANNHKS